MGRNYIKFYLQVSRTLVPVGTFPEDNPSERGRPFQVQVRRTERDSGREEVQIFSNRLSLRKFPGFLCKGQIRGTQDDGPSKVDALLWWKRPVRSGGEETEGMGQDRFRLNDGIGQKGSRFEYMKDIGGLPYFRS